MIALPFLPAEDRKTIQSHPTTSDHRGLENLFPICQWQLDYQPYLSTSNLERPHGSHQNQQWLRAVQQRPQQTSERKSSVAPLRTNSAPSQGSSTCLPLNQTHVRQKAEKTSTYVLAKVSEDCTLSSVVLMVSLPQPLNSAVLPMGSSTLCNSHEIAWRHQKFKMAPSGRVILSRCLTMLGSYSAGSRYSI